MCLVQWSLSTISFPFRLRNSLMLITWMWRETTVCRRPSSTISPTPIVLNRRWHPRKVHLPYISPLMCPKIKGLRVVNRRKYISSTSQNLGGIIALFAGLTLLITRDMSTDPIISADGEPKQRPSIWIFSKQFQNGIKGVVFPSEKKLKKMMRKNSLLKLFRFPMAVSTDWSRSNPKSWTGSKTFI